MTCRSKEVQKMGTFGTKKIK